MLFLFSGNTNVQRPLAASWFLKLKLAGHVVIAYGVFSHYNCDNKTFRRYISKQGQIHHFLKMNQGQPCFDGSLFKEYLWKAADG